MTPKEAYEVLREFQMWRRGEGKYRIQWDGSLHLEPLPYSPKEVGIALDVAIKTLKKEVAK